MKVGVRRRRKGGMPSISLNLTSCFGLSSSSFRLPPLSTSSHDAARLLASLAHGGFGLVIIILSTSFRYDRAVAVQQLRIFLWFTAALLGIDRQLHETISFRTINMRRDSSSGRGRCGDLPGNIRGLESRSYRMLISPAVVSS